MRLLPAVMVIIMFSGCVSTQNQPTATTLPSTSTTIQVETPTTTTHTTSTSSTQKQSTTIPVPTTIAVVKDVPCDKIENPMGPKDCERGYCTNSLTRCRYHPGNLYKPSTCKCL
ncbi:MAG: hypothetical protein NTU61_01145 [Candidatus Altiarchaeota archaeon]|nr:hypothetical protein [Candidatus Altiarchaeota archaeon]